jgi:hypothetical protein
MCVLWGESDFSAAEIGTPTFFFFFETPTCLKAFSPLSSALAYKKIQFFFTLTLSDFFLSSRIMSSVKALQTQQPKVVKNLANQQKAILKTT